jgi:hypothetical protein
MWKTILSRVAGFVTNRQDRKRALAEVEAKLRLASQEADSKLDLSDQQISAMLAKGLGDSWKDEYVTIIMSIPYLLMFAGGVLAAFNSPALLNGVAIGLEALTATGFDYGFVASTVFLAAVGVVAWRKLL